MGLRVELLGAVGVRDPDPVAVRGRQPALVFAYLVLERERPILREELADLLWGEHLPPHWAGAVRGVVTKIRNALGPSPVVAVESEGGALRVRLATGAAVDLEEALDASDGDDPRRLQEAAALLARPFLANADGEWVRRQRGRLAGGRRRALLSLARHGTAEGGSDTVQRELAALLEIDPYDEEVARRAIELHLATGQRAAAISVYETLRRRLDEDLGVRPARQTETLLLDALGSAPEPPPLDLPLATPTVTRFVGRRAELERLDGLATVARDGTLAVVAVEGEAGVGKSRLLGHWSGTGRVGRVLWGRCTGARLAYEPIAEAVGRLVHDEPELLTGLGGLRRALGTLLPEAAEDLAGPPSRDTEQQRARLFRALAAVVAAAAEPAGVALVVDDLQVADPDTLDVLHHLARALAKHSVLLALLVREPPPPVAALLAELQRRGMATVELRGLTSDEVQHLLDSAGLAGDRTSSSVVVQRTGGNPLYIHQLMEEALTAGRPVDPTIVPAALRDLLARRVRALGRGHRELLALAAVVGEVVDLPTLAACSSMDEDALLAAVDDLVHAGFLAPANEALVWSHGLVRDAVLADLQPARAAALHRRVVDAVAADAPAAVLAAHLREAGPSVAETAVRYGIAAGQAALAQSAWSVAAADLRSAAALARDDAERAEALIGLGAAERGRSNPAAARQALEQAVALARRTGDGRRLAAAVLGLVGGGGRGVATDLPDERRAELLREATRALHDGDDDLRVDVLCELALALVLTEGTAAERAELVDEAIAAARRDGSPDRLAAALLGRRTTLVDATSAEARLADAAEILRLPRDEVSAAHRLAALIASVEDLVTLGRREEAEPLLRAAEEEAGEYDHPYWQWAATTWRALVTVVDGEFEEAEHLAVRALGYQPENPEAVAALGVQLVNVRLCQDRAGEMLDLLGRAADENPHIPAYRAVLALCAASSGDDRLARAAVDALAADGFAALPADSNRFLALAVLADAAHRLGDEECEARLRSLLEPYRGLQVVLNCYGGGGAYWGPVDRFLDGPGRGGAERQCVWTR